MYCVSFGKLLLSFKNITGYVTVRPSRIRQADLNLFAKAQRPADLKGQRETKEKNEQTQAQKKVRKKNKRSPNNGPSFS